MTAAAPVVPREADESDAVRARYARRSDDDGRYSLLAPGVLAAAQERQRAMADLFAAARHLDLGRLRVMEIGCGTGANLLELLRFGVSPEHLLGIDLLPDSVEQARRVVPPTVRLTVADAANPDPSVAPLESQDIVYQSTVFSSLLDDQYQQRVAEAMWKWLRPGGAILWYDFTFDNPRNPDVRGVPVSRVRELFPKGALRMRRITLAPPIARAVTRVHPALYALCNSCIWLRTHVLAWIEKPR